MSSVIDVTQHTFKSTVIEADTLVVVDFWAQWCGPCLKLAPIIEDIAEELGDQAKFSKVNVDEERMLSMMYQILSIPTLLIFKNGQKVGEIVGAQPREKILETITEHL